MLGKLSIHFNQSIVDSRSEFLMLTLQNLNYDNKTVKLKV